MGVAMFKLCKDSVGIDYEESFFEKMMAILVVICIYIIAIAATLMYRSKKQKSKKLAC